MRAVPKLLVDLAAAPSILGPALGTWCGGLGRAGFGRARFRLARFALAPVALPAIEDDPDVRVIPEAIDEIVVQAGVLARHDEQMTGHAHLSLVSQGSDRAQCANRRSRCICGATVPNSGISRC